VRAVGRDFFSDRPNHAEQEIEHQRPASDAHTGFRESMLSRPRSGWPCSPDFWVPYPFSSMKAISLWQPWASLWCSPRKVHETRRWRCRHRGWLLVHAAKRFAKGSELDDPLRLILDDEFGGNWAKDLPTGALIGMVNVVDCQPTQTLFGDAVASDIDRICGDFAPGRFAWKRDEFRLFDQPIPYRGAQGIFNVPDDLIAVSGG
jgi:hypothetical protein